MTNIWLNDAAPKQLFQHIEFQMLLIDKLLKFINNGIIEHKITYSSSYYCRNFLPQQIVIEKLLN